MEYFYDGKISLFFKDLANKFQQDHTSLSVLQLTMPQFTKDQNINTYIGSNIIKSAKDIELVTHFIFLLLFIKLIPTVWNYLNENIVYLLNNRLEPFKNIFKKIFNYFLNKLIKQKKQTNIDVDDELSFDYELTIDKCPRFGERLLNCTEYQLKTRPTCKLIPFEKHLLYLVSENTDELRSSDEDSNTTSKKIKNIKECVFYGEYTAFGSTYGSIPFKLVIELVSYDHDSFVNNRWGWSDYDYYSDCKYAKVTFYKVFTKDCEHASKLYHFINTCNYFSWYDKYADYSNINDAYKILYRKIKQERIGKLSIKILNYCYFMKTIDYSIDLLMYGKAGQGKSSIGYYIAALCGFKSIAARFDHDCNQDTSGELLYIFDEVDKYLRYNRNDKLFDDKTKVNSDGKKEIDDRYNKIDCIITNSYIIMCNDLNAIKPVFNKRGLNETEESLFRFGRFLTIKYEEEPPNMKDIRNFLLSGKEEPNWIVEPNDSRFNNLFYALSDVKYEVIYLNAIKNFIYKAKENLPFEICHEILKDVQYLCQNDNKLFPNIPEVVVTEKPTAKLSKKKK